jgi:hypothetical protein
VVDTEIVQGVEPYQLAQTTVGAWHDHHGVQQGSAWHTVQLHGSGAVQQTGRHAYGRQQADRHGVANGSCHQDEPTNGPGAHQPTGRHAGQPHGSCHGPHQPERLHPLE